MSVGPPWSSRSVVVADHAGRRARRRPARRARRRRSPRGAAPATRWCWSPPGRSPPAWRRSGWPRRPRDLATQQAAASRRAGAARRPLHGRRSRAHGLTVGQVLLTADDVVRRTPLPQRPAHPRAAARARRRAGRQRERHRGHRRDPVRRQRPARRPGRAPGRTPTRSCCCRTSTRSTTARRARAGARRIAARSRRRRTSTASTSRRPGRAGRHRRHGRPRSRRRHRDAAGIPALLTWPPHAARGAGAARTSARGSSRRPAPAASRCCGWPTRRRPQGGWCSTTGRSRAVVERRMSLLPAGCHRRSRAVRGR